jgi:hypothetical protein
MCLVDEHLKGHIKILATEIKPDIERSLKQKQLLMSSLITDFVKEYC